MAQADVIIDPFRPGVLERMGLGPKECEELSGGRVILARLTGYRRAGSCQRFLRRCRDAVEDGH